MIQGHAPRKSLGQHFLADRSYVAAIVAAIAPQPDDLMVEIGPGLGALTEPLLQHLRHLHVVELDGSLAQRLETRFAPQRLNVHRANALEFDFAALGPGLRVVGNLPYNISTPLLFRVAQAAERVRDCHFMLQREVVERMAAAPGTPAYGRLSVMLQYRFAVEKLLRVPPGAFQPPPKVDSAVVRLLPLVPLPCPARDEALFARLVADAFAQRRKMLRAALRGWLAAEDLEALGIDPTLRGETLPVCEFVRIADHVAGLRERQAK